MRPRSIALLAAALAGLVGIAVAVMGRDEATPTDAMHRDFHVRLDVPPVEAALWFAARFPQYFSSGEAELRPWLDSLDPRDRDFVIAMGQTLTWAWIEHELAGFREREPAGLAREATFAIRRATLNQLELNARQYPEVDAIAFDAEIADPEFAMGVFARLVRGVSNCEGQNHLLALLLDTALEPDRIDAFMVGTRGHDLVVLEGPTLAQPIYVDAWSNLPAFVLDASSTAGVASLAELGEAPPPVVPGMVGRAPLPAAAYAESIEHPLAVALLSAREAPSKPVDLDVQAPALDEAGLARVKDPWKLYLFARILHIYDDPRAGDLYRLVLERHCGPRVRLFVCAASTALLERLSGP